MSRLGRTAPAGRWSHHLAAALALAVLILGGCGEADEGAAGDKTTNPSVGAAPATGDAGGTPAIDAAHARLDEIDEAVARWADAGSLDEAAAAAEEARGLVTGEVASSGPPGLLPGRGGEAGLVSPLAGCAAVEADVLGGDWSDPAGRWAVADEAIAEWAPGNNTFPSLPSHPQRVVGWATLTVETSSLDDAHEYAGHAKLHVDVSREALSTC